MEHVNLEGNNIRELELSKYYDLRDLNMGSNEIRSLSKGQLNHHKKLGFLRFSNNKISNIDVAAFDNLTRISILHLDNNKVNLFMMAHRTAVL